MKTRRTLPFVLLLALACESSVVVGPRPVLDAITSAPVASIDIAPATVTLNAIGDSALLVATAKDSAGDPVAVPVSWRSADTTRLQVDSTGLLVARGVGKIKVTASVGAGASKVFRNLTVTVRQVVATLQVTPMADTLFAIGDTLRLTAEARDSNGVIAPTRMVWRALDTLRVGVDTLGLATARSAGTGRIKLSAGGLAVTARITVRPTAVGIQFNDTSLALPGDTLRLKATVVDANGNPLAGAISFKGLTDSIITVSATGHVTAKHMGWGRVRAKSGVMTVIANVMVGGRVTQLNLTPIDTIDALRDSVQLVAVAQSETGDTLTAVPQWTSLVDTVAVVTAGGMLITLRNGYGSVVATVAGVADTIPVVVRQRAVVANLVTPITTFNALGDTALVTLDAYDRKGKAIRAFGPVWSVSDVSVTAMVTPKDKPFARIYVQRNGFSRIISTMDGLVDTLDITVQQEAANVEVVPASAALAVNDTLHITARVVDPFGSPMEFPAPITWTSSDTTIAVVDSAGTVIVIGVGSATITATSAGATGVTSIVASAGAPEAAEIRVSPDTATFAIGVVKQLDALVLTAENVPINDAPTVWTSLTPELAEVDSAGRVTILGAGTARIEARIDEVADTATFTTRVRDARPNIVLILSDDQEFTSWSAMPHLRNEIQNQGTTYQNFLVTDPLCCPSRASFLRGQYVPNHGVMSNLAPDGGFERFQALGLESSTVAVWLRNAGYHTALIGKYLNGYPLLPITAYVPPGWDTWISWVNTPGIIIDEEDPPLDPEDRPAFSVRQYGYDLVEGNSVVHYGFRPEDYLTDMLAQKAGAFVRKRADDGAPFFLYLTPYSPQLPAIAAPRHQGMTAPTPFTSPSFNEADMSDKPGGHALRLAIPQDSVLFYEQQHAVRMDMLKSVDEMIKTVVDSLRAGGVLDNTYIFYTSDNGYHQGEHRLRPGKGRPYEEDIRPGLAVRGPGVTAGRIAGDMILNNDIAPTLAALAGATAPSFVDGRSVVSSLHGGTTTRAGAMIGIYQTTDPPSVTWQGVRTPTHTYVEYSNGEHELYDNVADPYQMTNIYHTADPGLVSSLASWLARLRTCAGSGCQIAEDTP